jgi:hypothetical protein
MELLDCWRKRRWKQRQRCLWKCRRCEQVELVPQIAVGLVVSLVGRSVPLVLLELNLGGLRSVEWMEM